MPDVVGLTLPEAREFLREWPLRLTPTAPPGSGVAAVDESDDADPPWRVLRQQVDETGTVILTVAPEETVSAKERAD